MMLRKGLALPLLIMGATICIVRSEVCQSADIGVDLSMTKNGLQLAEPEFSGPGEYTISCTRPCACAADCFGATCPQTTTPPGFQVCAKAYAICVDWVGTCTGYETDDGNFKFDLSVTFPDKPPANVQRGGPPMGIGATTISPCEGSLFKCAATPGACSLASCKCCEPACFVDV